MSNRSITTTQKRAIKSGRKSARFTETLAEYAEVQKQLRYVSRNSYQNGSN